jgi:hypothetical protein
MIYSGKGLDIALDFIRLYNWSLADLCVDAHFSECWRSGARGIEGGEEIDDGKKMERRRIISKKTRT